MICASIYITWKAVLMIYGLGREKNGLFLKVLYYFILPSILYVLYYYRFCILLVVKG